MNYLENQKVKESWERNFNFLSRTLTVCGLTMQYANFTRTNPSKMTVYKRVMMKDVSQLICQYVLFHDSTVVHLPDRAAYAALPA